MQLQEDAHREQERQSGEDKTQYDRRDLFLTAQKIAEKTSSMIRRTVMEMSNQCQNLD